MWYYCLLAIIRNATDFHLHFTWYLNHHLSHFEFNFIRSALLILATIFANSSKCILPLSQGSCTCHRIRFMLLKVYPISCNKTCTYLSCHRIHVLLQVHPALATEYTSCPKQIYPSLRLRQAKVSTCLASSDWKCSHFTVICLCILKTEYSSLHCQLSRPPKISDIKTMIPIWDVRIWYHHFFTKCWNAYVYAIKT